MWGFPGAAESDAGSEVSPFVWCDLEVRSGVGSCAVVTVESSAAAKRSLSSWYFRRDSRGRTPFSRYVRRETRVLTTSSSEDTSRDVSGDDRLRSLRMMRKTRFWRYERRSSFLVSKRDIPSGGGWRVVVSGREFKAECSDSVKVDINSPGVPIAADMVRK